MDYRQMDLRAEELRTLGAATAARMAAGETIAPEERDALMKGIGELTTLDALRVAARDAETAELRAIIENGVRPGEKAGDPAALASEAAFRSFMKSGPEGMPAEMRAALVAGTDANGGFLVPEPVHAPLIEKFRRVSPLLEEVTVMPMTGDTTMYLPRKDSHGVVGAATETGTRSEQTEPAFLNGSLQAFDIYSDQRATQQWIDSVTGAEDMMTGWIYEDFAEQFATDIAFGAGYGSQKAAGIFKATATYVTQLSGAAGALVNTAFYTQMFALPQKYRFNAKWYMAPSTLAVALQMSVPNLNNTPLVENRNGSFFILGKPVVEVDDAPAIGAAAYPVAFGDLKKGYAVGIHRAASILRDPYTVAPYIRFYGLARMGGTPWDKDAVILQKSNNS